MDISREVRMSSPAAADAGLFPPKSATALPSPSSLRRAAQAAAALEGNAALFAQRHAQQVAVVGRAGDLVFVVDEGDLDHG